MEQQVAPQSGEPRFGDVAIELNLLLPEQVEQLLAKQKHYRDIGLPKRIDELAVEMGVMARVDCDFVLSELHRRREAVHGKPAAAHVPGADDEDEEAPVPPCRLGDFELEARLQTMKGLVYKAFDRQSQMHVAVKLLPHFLSADRAWVACFQRDVRVAARLSHPNIIKFYRAGELEGRFFIALECVEGEMLSARLEHRGRLKELEALRIAREMAYALYHSHVLGLLLRDVRPENVIIEPTGRSRFADLGVGKVTSDDPRLIACGLAVESPHYQSPEQIRGTMVVGRRSDLYGLGATLYHMLTGQPPFTGAAEEVRERIVHEEPPDPRTFVPEISPLACELVLQLLAKDPEQRVKRADGVIEMADRILGSALQSMRAGLQAASGRAPAPARPVPRPPAAEPLLEELESEPAPVPEKPARGPRPSGRGETKSQKRVSGRRKKA
jgi:hypothetical protein